MAADSGLQIKRSFASPNRRANALSVEAYVHASPDAQ